MISPDSAIGSVPDLKPRPEASQLLASHIIRLATAVRRAATQRFRRMFGLSMIEWLVIAHLATEAPLTLTALARSANLDNQRTSAAVTQLAKRELVWRTKNPSNGREAQVALTPRGRAVFNAIIENWLQKELAHGMTEAELAAATEVLERLATRADHILSLETKLGGI